MKSTVISGAGRSVSDNVCQERGTNVDQIRFNAVTHSLTHLPSRRAVLRGLVGAGLGFSALAGVAFDTLDADARKKRDKKQNSKSVTRTVRQSVTRTFTNAQPISIPNGAPGTTVGAASPSPSTIAVSGFANGVITDVNLTLHDFSHTKPQDVDILLVVEQLPGQNALVMGDVGSTNQVAGLTLTLDDQAASPLSVNGPLVSGTFQPHDNDAEVTLDAFPGQTPSGNSRLSLFNGSNPNGSWQLFVADDRVAGTGQIAGGWSLQITADADVQVKERAKDKKRRKGKRRR
jgi:hypothetical protein